MGLQNLLGERANLVGAVVVYDEPLRRSWIARPRHSA